jgi:hypothetical protein
MISTAFIQRWNHLFQSTIRKREQITTPNRLS